ncbi:MAG: NAD(P)H-dependent oxidoreductase subunit E [Clostridiales bacterium]|jgi:NADP-reducing hydrogenase subunit HndA|nr:NAD(P)H-dependent oxidoreductase subunit E [Clostridiales bacterium]
MAKTKTLVPFKGTSQQEEQLRAAIAEHKDEKGALMPILQKAQHIYGYLPEEVQKIIAEELKISLSEVYGVVTFYSQFTLNPKGEHQINICLGTACYVKGSQKILEEFEAELGIPVGGVTSDGKFSLDATRCIGACGLAPVLTIKTGDSERVFGRLVPGTGEVKKILSNYK